MGRMLRFEQSGAVFSEDMTNLQDLRDRGTITGSPVIVRSPRGRAIDFDGTADYWSESTADFRIGDSAGSICAWVRFDGLGTRDVIFASCDASTTNYHVTFRKGTGDVICISQKNNDTEDQIHGTTVFAADTWYHVAVVSNGTAYALYVNGVAESLTIESGANNGDWFADTPSRDNISIGARVDGTVTGYFNGAISALSIWDRALSATEVSQLAAQTVWDYWTDLISVYDLSEIDPQDLGYKGNGNAGTGVGIVASTDLIAGPYGGYATQYNGTDERTNFGDVGNIRTISVMVKPDTTTEELVYIDTGKDIMVNAGTVTYTGVTASATFVDGVATTTMVAGVWQHLVCVLNADVDANLLGLAYDGTNFGAISVDHFAVFGAALEQVQATDYGQRLALGLA